MKYTRITTPKYERDAWMLFSMTLLVALVIGKLSFAVEAYIDEKNPIISPLADNPKEYIEKTIYVTPTTIEDKIRAVFGKDGDLAVRVAKCESGLNPKAKNSTSSARGLFQIMQSWHKIDQKWLFNEDVNIQVAYKLYQESGNSFSPHWDASKHCWSK